MPQRHNPIFGGFHSLPAALCAELIQVAVDCTALSAIAWLAVGKLAGWEMTQSCRLKSLPLA